MKGKKARLVKETIRKDVGCLMVKEDQRKKQDTWCKVNKPKKKVDCEGGKWGKLYQRG